MPPISTNPKYNESIYNLLLTVVVDTTLYPDDAAVYRALFKLPTLMQHRKVVQHGARKGAVDPELRIGSIKTLENKWIKGRPLREGEYWVVWDNNPDNIRRIETKFCDVTNTLFYCVENTQSWHSLNSIACRFTHYQKIQKPYCTHYDLGVQPPPMPMETHDELVSAAAEATEVCSEDELEQHSAKIKQSIIDCTAEHRCQRCHSYIMNDNGLCCNHPCIFSEHRQDCVYAIKTLTEGDEYNQVHECTCGTDWNGQ